MVISSLMQILFMYIPSSDSYVERGDAIANDF